MDRNKRIILSLILMSYFVTAIDGSIVITGLTRISDDLNLTPTTLSWVQNAYVLAWGGFMLMGGRMGDTYGRKRMFNLSLIIFALGSLGAGVAGSAVAMIASRFVQGVGSAVMAPSSLALIMDYFEGRQRVRAVAWYGSISGIGMCVGLILGGAITSYLSWRIGFLINIPIVAVMVLLSVRYLKGDVWQQSRFDVLGTFLSVAFVFVLIYAIDGAESPVVWGIFGVVLLVAFVFTERRAAIPIMPLYLFADADRRNAYIVRALHVAAMMGFNFFISEYMQKTMGFSPLVAGVGFLPMTLTTFIGALCVPSLVGRYGNKRILFLGLSLMAIGFGSMTLLDAHSHYLQCVALPMLFVGMGNGLTMSPLTNFGIAGVRTTDSGTASGLVNVSHQFGGALGLSSMVAASDGIVDMASRCRVGMMVALSCVLLAFIVLTVKHLWSMTARSFLNRQRC